MPVMALPRLEALLLRCCLWLLRRMSPAAASNLGGGIARTVGPLLPVTRVGDANLRLAFPAMKPAARRRVLRNVWDNLGRTTAELAHLGDLRRTAAGPGWEIEGEAVILEAMRQGGPVVLISAHCGNWEIQPAVCAALGRPMSSFYRPPGNPFVAGLLEDLRRRAAGPGTGYFAKGSPGARAALAHLRGGGLLGLLIDQKMNDGIAAPLFGHLAMTAPAAATLALRFGCKVIPTHVVRLGPARLRVVVDPPMPHPSTGDRQADIASFTAAMNATLEGWIRERPGEWLWLHRRWPKPPAGQSSSDA